MYNLGMKFKEFVPQTKLGKWSICFHSFFLVAVFISITLVKLLGILHFEDKWWDVTVGIIFPVSFLAFIMGIIAINSKKDKSLLTLLSVLLGLLVILFVIFHQIMTGIILIIINNFLPLHQFLLADII